MKTATKVAIRSVTLDPPFTKHPTLQRYRVTLECGCLWWEDHTELEQLPRAGQFVETDMRPMHGHTPISAR